MSAIRTCRSSVAIPTEVPVGISCLVVVSNSIEKCRSQAQYFALFWRTISRCLYVGYSVTSIPTSASILGAPLLHGRNQNSSYRIVIRSQRSNKRLISDISEYATSQFVFMEGTHWICPSSFHLDSSELSYLAVPHLISSHLVASHLVDDRTVAEQLLRWNRRKLSLLLSNLSFQYYSPIIIKVLRRQQPPMPLSWTDPTFGMLESQSQPRQQSKSQLFNEQQHENYSERPSFGPMHIDKDKHADEWIAETAIDARPLLPKAAFFIGDLRDGLPMVSPVCPLLHSITFPTRDWYFIYIYPSMTPFPTLPNHSHLSSILSSSICKPHSWYRPSHSQKNK